MKRKTAVDLLIDFMKDNEYFIGNDLIEAYVKCMEIEQRQIQDAFESGTGNEWFQRYINSEDYYNKNYGI